MHLARLVRELDRRSDDAPADSVIDEHLAGRRVRVIETLGHVQHRRPADLHGRQERAPVIEVARAENLSQFADQLLLDRPGLSLRERDQLLPAERREQRSRELHFAARECDETAIARLVEIVKAGAADGPVRPRRRRRTARQHRS